MIKLIKNYLTYIKNFSFYMFLILILFNSCKLNNSGSNSRNLKSPDQVVIKFLEWYRDNYDQLYKFYEISEKDDSSHMINGKIGDSTVYYTINYKGTEKFLNSLKSCGFLSDKYLKNKRNSFKKRGKILNEAKQNDGPPEGFSAEEIFI